MKKEDQQKLIIDKLEEIQKMLEDWKSDDQEDYINTGDPIFVPVYIPVVPDYETSNPYRYRYNPCQYCDNNPANNPFATGICHCILGSPVIF